MVNTCPKKRRPINNKCQDGYYSKANKQGFDCCYKFTKKSQEKPKEKSKEKPKEKPKEKSKITKLELYILMNTVSNIINSQAITHIMQQSKYYFNKRGNIKEIREIYTKLYNILMKYYTNNNLEIIRNDVKILFLNYIKTKEVDKSKNTSSPKKTKEELYILINTVSKIMNSKALNAVLDRSKYYFNKPENINDVQLMYNKLIDIIITYNQNNDVEFVKTNVKKIFLAYIKNKQLVKS
jgi:hypothetical protein